MTELIRILQRLLECISRNLKVLWVRTLKSCFSEFRRKPSLGSPKILSIPLPFLNRGSRFHCSLLFSITFVLKYDYEFLTCILKKMILRGKSAKSQSEMLSVPFPNPLRGRSPLRGGANKRITFQTSYNEGQKC